jgi:hypothetical protein
MRAIRITEKELLKETGTLVTVCGGAWESGNLAGVQYVHVLTGWEKNPICIAQPFDFLFGVIVKTGADTQRYNFRAQVEKWCQC